MYVYIADIGRGRPCFFAIILLNASRGVV
jgi:hypothetical protein